MTLEQAKQLLREIGQSQDLNSEQRARVLLAIKLVANSLGR